MVRMKLNLGNRILLIYMDNLQKNMEKWCIIILSWIKSLHIIQKYSYSKIYIEKWQEGNSPDFSADSLWVANDFIFFFKFFFIYKIYNRKKTNIRPGINLAVTNSMGCLDLKTVSGAGLFALKEQLSLRLRLLSWGDHHQLQHHSSALLHWLTVLRCASLSENSCLYSTN